MRCQFQASVAIDHAGVECAMGKVYDRVSFLYFYEANFTRAIGERYVELCLCP